MTKFWKIILPVHYSHYLINLFNLKLKATTCTLNGLNMENMQTFGESLLEHCKSELAKQKNLNARLKEWRIMMQAKVDESMARKKSQELVLADKISRLASLREKTSKIALNATNANATEAAAFFNFKQDKYETTQAELKTILAKNKNIDK